MLYFATLQCPYVDCSVGLLSRSITQAVAVDACIRCNKLALKTEEIVRVNREQWTVKPSLTKRLIAPTNHLSHTSESASQDAEGDDSESATSGSAKVTEATGPAYICRPEHRQPPHTGLCMYKWYIHHI